MHKVVDDSHLHSMIDLYYYCIRNDRLVRRVSYKKQELLTIHDQLDRPLIFDGVCGVHPFRFLCCVFVFCLSSFCVLCALFVIILCLVCFVCHHSLSCVLCLSSFCVLCAQCSQCLCYVHSLLALRVSLIFVGSPYTNLLNPMDSGDLPITYNHSVIELLLCNEYLI